MDLGMYFSCTVYNEFGGSTNPDSAHEEVQNISQQKICWYSEQQDCGETSSKSPEKHTQQLVPRFTLLHQIPTPSTQKQDLPLHLPPQQFAEQFVQEKAMHAHLLYQRKVVMVNTSMKIEIIHKNALTD